MHNSNYDNPIFKTQSGLELKLKHINPNVLDFWRITYTKSNPEPKPPVKELSNGDLYPQVKDENYIYLLEKWQSELNTALGFWMLEHGVLTEPPEDYKPMFEIDHYTLKQMWLYETLEPQDIAKLYEAVAGLNVVSQEDIESAEKN